MGSKEAVTIGRNVVLLILNYHRSQDHCGSRSLRCIKLGVLHFSVIQLQTERKYAFRDTRQPINPFCTININVFILLTDALR